MLKKPTTENANDNNLSCVLRLLSFRTPDFPSDPNVDYAGFGHFVALHGLAPIVADALLERGEHYPELFPDLFRYSLLHQRHMESVTSVLLSIHKGFEKRGVRYLTWKGPALSSLLHGGNPILRPSTDLDLLVPGNDGYRRAAVVLKGLGFELSDKGVEREHRSFVRREDHLTVELHHHVRIGERTVSYRERWWGNTLHADLRGRKLPVPALIPLLLMLTAHGAKHRWERLRWVYDVALLLKNFQNEIDWDEAVEEAQRLKTIRRFLHGCHLAGDLFHAPMPDSIQDQASQKLGEDKLMGFHRSCIANAGSVAPSSKGIAFAKLLQAEGLTDMNRSALWVFQRAVALSDQDKADIRLKPLAYLNRIKNKLR